MGTRDGAIGRARAFFESGFAERLGALVAIPSTSQDPGHEADVRRYLEDGIRPWLARMGFAVTLHDNPARGFGPILTAERIERPGLPTVLAYGHGATVRGLDEQWSEGRTPWAMRDEGDRWYGRGTADNKRQHVINLSALEAVLAERGDALGFNLKLVLERGCEGTQPLMPNSVPAPEVERNRSGLATTEISLLDKMISDTGNRKYVPGTLAFYLTKLARLGVISPAPAIRRQVSSSSGAASPVRNRS